jgi:hypothetical protein
VEGTVVHWVVGITEATDRQGETGEEEDDDENNDNDHHCY